MWSWFIVSAVAASGLQGPDQADGGRDAPARDLPTAPRPSLEIVNGDDAGPDIFPSTGGMIFEGTLTVPPLFGGSATTQRVRQFACSSTLIAPDVVLLAAHCVDPDVLAQGGSAEGLTFWWSRASDLTEPATPLDSLPDDAVRASEAVIPAAWSPDNLGLGLGGDAKFDLAMLFLEAPVLDVEPAILATSGQAAALTTGAEVMIVGWGLTIPLSLFDSFLPPEPGTFGHKQWGFSALGEVGTWEIQVGQVPDDVRKCRGDSGGPTFLRVDHAPTAQTSRLVGVTSRSADLSLCATEGGFDTRIDAYLDWIDTEMRAGCAEGRRSWCEEEGILLEDHSIFRPPPVAGELIAGCQTAPVGPRGMGIALLALLGLRRQRRR